jgi:hypothetical protein
MYLARPAAQQIFSYKWGAAGLGGIAYYMFMFEWSALVSCDPPEGHPAWTICVHFRDSYPIDVSRT